MADPPSSPAVSSSPAVLDPNGNLSNNNDDGNNNNNNNDDEPSNNSQQPESDNTIPRPDQPTPPQQQTSTPTALNPNPNPSPTVLVPPPAPSYVVPPISGSAVSPAAISFRIAPQFSPVPNMQSTSVGVQPPGVTVAPVLGQGGATLAVPPPPMTAYQVPPGQALNPALRPFVPPVPNGFPAPTGIPHYPSAYPAIPRPVFPPRPPGVPGVPPAVSRPLGPVIPGVHTLFSPVIRPVLPSVTPAEKPQTTVYVGKIAPTVENDLMLSLLQFCGPVKSWKRAQDPTDGTPRGFGFCEFESAEGILRALHLLSKFNIDGQELVLNVNQATREYLDRYVKKKTENSKNLKEIQAAGMDKEEGSAPSVEKNEPSKSSVDDSYNDSDKGKTENHDLANFGIVTDEDKEADREALEKLTGIIEERSKTKPLPPPPPQEPQDVSGNSNSELPSKSRDGDSDVDTIRNDAVEDKNDDDTTSENKAASEQDKPDTCSPDKSRRSDRRSKDKDREWDPKREKERQIERYERDTERQRVRKGRVQRRKIEEAEREYEERLKDWEYIEREKEKQQQYEREREKEREHKRKKEILHDEEEDNDDLPKRWRRSVLEDKRRKRLWEKEEDLADRLKGEEEAADAQRRAEEERWQQQHRNVLKTLFDHVLNGNENTVLAEEARIEDKNKAVEKDYEGGSGNENKTGDRVLQNGAGDESVASIAESDSRQSANAPTRKLGFGLVGSGKRAAVPSVFYEEDDDDAHKEKKMRPLVPIDYSTEELQAVQPPISGAQPPNLVAAAEFAKRISNVAPKEEKPDAERERSKRSYDRSRQRDRDRNDEDNNRTRDENREKILERGRDRESGLDKVKTQDKQKLLDAKQLIDMIPKTKEELFSYEINWAVYDKHGLHERMRPWISKKITEFLGEEEATLVDYIVSSTQEHVKASKMLEMLQSILDDEAEMFVLKMWRMLIFEIKKVETGL